MMTPEVVITLLALLKVAVWFVPTLITALVIAAYCERK